MGEEPNDKGATIVHVLNIEVEQDKVVLIEWQRTSMERVQREWVANRPMCKYVFLGQRGDIWCPNGPT